MGKYLAFSEIRFLQMEPTSKCNLLCPQCARVDNGKINPLLPLTELIPEDYDRIFTNELSDQLEHIWFNGSYGDPVASRHLNYVIDKLSCKKITFTIFTNGSLNSATWWRDLGNQFSKTNSTVVFSIDGLKDTNHIYRVNSNFKKIMENATAYIQAGGRARWDFLVFEHNQHQVKEAMVLAKKMGFKEFHKKNTARFISGDYTSRRSSYKVFNRKGNVINQLKEPSKKRTDFEEVLKKYDSWDEYIDTTPIHCKFQNGKGIFIDCEALVWPLLLGGCSNLLYKSQFFRKKTV